MWMARDHRHEGCFDGDHARTFEFDPFLQPGSTVSSAQLVVYVERPIPRSICLDLRRQLGNLPGRERGNLTIDVTSLVQKLECQPSMKRVLSLE